MGSGKHSNSDDTSSEDLELDQIDDQGKVSEDDNDDDDGTTGGVGRSYGCTFCKRGFTNAQALGGHMNIHRKDKAKSKSKQQKNNNHRRHQESSSSTWLSNKSHTSVSSQYAAASVGAYMNNYHQAGYFPASNYNNPSRYNNNHHYDFMMTTSPGTAAVPDDQRLSLRIGSTPTTRNKEEDEDGEDRLIDIDLELRLGH